MIEVKSSRISSLDILRVLLAFIIFLFHSMIHIGCSYSFLSHFLHSGAIAVTGFFILSGYTIQMVYNNKISDMVSVFNFYKKRFLSIYPLYFIVGFVYVIMCILAGKQSIWHNIVLMPIELLCLQSYFETLFPFSHNSGTWFISCLITCYAIYPCINKLIKSLTSGCLLIGVILICLLLVYCPFVAYYFKTAGLYTNPFFRLLEFISGVILAQVQLNGWSKSYFKTKTSSLVFMISIIVLIIGVSVNDAFKMHIQSLFVVPCFLVIVHYLGGCNKRTNWGNTKLIRFLSDMSFSFFVCQLLVWNPIKYLLLVTGDLPNVFKVVLSFVMCLVISVIIHMLVERRLHQIISNRIKIS